MPDCKLPARTSALFTALAAAGAVGVALSVWVSTPAAAADAAGAAGGTTAATAAAATPLPPASLAEPRFQSVGVGAIPRGVVPALAQDRAGFLWVATGDGLVRFDGYHFKPQLRDSSDPTVRNLGWVRALLASRDGRVWIGTEAEGLAVHDPATGRIDSRRSDGAAPGRAAALPTVLALAEGADGSIWSGTAGGGLQRVDPTTGRFHTLRAGSAAGSLPDDRVQALRVDRRGDLWVGTSRGLSRLARGGTRFDTIDAPPVSALLESADGRIWVGTQRGDVGVLDPGLQPLRWLNAAGASDRTESPSIQTDHPVAAHDGNGAVSSLLEAPGGRIWVGRTSGVDVLDGANGHRLWKLRHDPRQPYGLADDEVTALLRDQAGSIWVAGLGLGLQRHDPDNHSIWIRGGDAGAGSRLEQADLRSLLALDNGHIWLATHRRGIAVLGPQLQAAGAVRLPPSRDPTTTIAQPSAPADASPDPRVTAMAQARDGTVWLGTDDRLFQLDRQGQLVRSLRHDGGRCARLRAGSDGSIWIATVSGLLRLAAGAPAPQRLTLQDGQPLVAAVFDVAEQGDSAWVAAASGLYRIAPGSHHLQLVSSPAGAGLANPTVIGLLVDSRQTLWVDTAVTGLHRLLRWNSGQAEFDRISLRHGGVGRPFGVNLLEDAQGRIWSQMHVYDPAADRLDGLTAADGVTFGTGWFGSYTQLRDGRMLFGGSRGLLVVDPGGWSPSHEAPPLVVSGLRVNGEPRLAGSLAAGLQLAPAQRSFSIEFAALDYGDPGRIRYAYRLRGFDPDWLATGAELRAASYSNLDPGDYTLQVRATNRSGIWSPHELSIPVQVLPAWWQRDSTRLALSLLGLLLAALLVSALVQARTRNLRRSSTDLERKVRERTVALEATTQALRSESAALAEASLTDPLTGWRNRRYLGQHLDTDVALALRRHASALRAGEAPPDDADLLFFLFDIDDFKRVNDDHGHDAGDAVIVQFSTRLRQVFRDTDHLVRWGGEEFLVVARGSARAHAAELAERARAAIAAQPFDLPGGRHLVRTCSIGFCCFPLAPQQPEAIGWPLAVACADAALYAAKGAGRNGWLGLLQARGDAPAPLQARARGPLAEWVRSGELDWVGSPQFTAWRSAESADDGMTAVVAATAQNPTRDAAPNAT